MKSPFLIKLASLGAIAAALLLALSAIDGVVRERQQRRAEAEQSVAASLAGAQTVLGPALLRECQETWTRTDGDGAHRTRTAERREFRQILYPRHLDVVTAATIDPRYRGLFKVNGFVSRSTITATWDEVAAPEASAGLADVRLRCDAAVLTVEVGDARGIRAAEMRVDGAATPVEAGSPMVPNGRGFHATLAESPARKGPLRAEVTLTLVGTGSLAWVPIGDDTRVRASSDWPHPAFGGQFLPSTREVGPRGFEARWQVSALATTAQEALRGKSGICALAASPDEEAVGGRCVDRFGVRFIDPVDGYVLANRAIKYGVLFIALTFVGVALVEATRRLRVHPIQYLLVGCALTVFFLLLTSLDEHLGFARAYLCASTACTALLTFYGVNLLGRLRRGLAFGAGIAALYATLYAVLQLEQTALVLGASLLFAALATVMVVTRRLDWYALTASRADFVVAPLATAPVRG